MKKNERITVKTDQVTVHEKISGRQAREFRDYMKKASPEDRAFINQTLGEQQGEKVTSKHMKGMKETMSGSDKTCVQGWDRAGVTKSGRVIAIEDKGGKARLSELQKKPSWAPERARLVEKKAGNYANSSGMERKQARAGLKAQANGDGTTTVVTNSKVVGKNEIKTTIKVKDVAYRKNAGSPPAGPVKVTRGLSKLEPLIDPAAKRAGGKTQFDPKYAVTKNEGKAVILKEILGKSVTKGSTGISSRGYGGNTHKGVRP